MAPVVLAPTSLSYCGYPFPFCRTVARGVQGVAAGLPVQGWSRGKRRHPARTAEGECLDAVPCILAGLCCFFSPPLQTSSLLPAWVILLFLLTLPGGFLAPLAYYFRPSSSLRREIGSPCLLPLSLTLPAECEWLTLPAAIFFHPAC